MHVLVRPLAAALIVGLTAAPVPAGDGPADDTPAGLTERMHGEEVLTGSGTPLLNPICRFEHHPWFELSDPRPGRLLGEALLVDFAALGRVTGPISVVLVEGGRRRRFPVPPEALRENRGTLRCRYADVGDDAPPEANLEVYVELTDADAAPVRRGRDEERRPVDPLYFKVSQSVTRGEVAETTLARELRPAERRIYEARREREGPPPLPPGGFEAGGPGVPLVAGTPVLALKDREWLPAEVLRVSGTDVVVHWDGTEHRTNRLVPRTAVAVSADTRRKLGESPDAFAPSVRLLAGALVPPPAGQVPLPDDRTLPPGVPVSPAAPFGDWTYFVALDRGAEVLVYESGGFGSVREHPRDRLSAPADALARLEEPGAAAEFRDALERLREGARRTRRPRTYAPDVPPPAGFVPAGAATELPPGTECRICWARTWQPAVVVWTFGDGSVEIKRDGWGLVEPVTRDSLFVRAAVAAGPAGGGESPDSEPADPDEPAAARYRVTLTAVPANRARTARVTMALASVSLTEALELIGELPLNLSEDFSRREAEKWAARFKTAGAEVRVEPVR